MGPSAHGEADGWQAGVGMTLVPPTKLASADLYRIEHAIGALRAGPPPEPPIPAHAHEPQEGPDSTLDEVREFIVGLQPNQFWGLLAALMAGLGTLAWLQYSRRISLPWISKFRKENGDDDG